MTASAELKATADLTDGEVADLAAMKEAVYPEPPSNQREWAPREWGVFVRSDGELVSYTGIVLRRGAVGDEPVTIGGIGGVATHPSHRGRGYAALGMGRALDFMLAQDADFALLVCRDELVPYYESLGWRLFEGTAINTQFGEREIFDFNRVMVGDLRSKSPREGTIDLRGPAW